MAIRHTEKPKSRPAVPVAGSRAHRPSLHTVGVVASVSFEASAFSIRS